MKKSTCATSLRFPTLAALMLLASARIAAADSLSVQWDLNPEPEVDGYVVHVGNQPNTYTQAFDVGNTDTFTLTTAVPGVRYCFAVSAYDGTVFSPKSNEVCGYSNESPTLNAPGNRQGTVGTPATLQLVGADPDGGSVTYSATGLPPGLTIASGSGLISGTPTTAGVYNVIASVSDGVLTTNRSFTWTITAPVNVSPVLTNPGNQSGTTGQAATLQLQATDANTDVLSYSASGLPAGLNVASASGLISGTPTTAGTYNVTATVSDGSLFAIQSFTWTIVAPNVGPILAVVANQSGTVGVAASLQLNASDANGDTLTYSATGLPGGLTLGTSNGLISGTPTTAGTFNVTVTVGDGSLTASRNFTWTIAPANAPPVVTNPGNQTGTVGDPVSLQVQATDASGTTLTFTAAGLPPGLQIATNTGLITGSPTTAGVYAVTVTVSDGQLSASQNFTWTIQSPAPQNGAPSLSNPGTQSTQQGTAVNLQVQASDPDHDPLTFTATGLPPGLTISSSGLIAGAPTAAGTYTVTITVTDGTTPVAKGFTWTVLAPNVAPTLAFVASQTGTVGVAASLQLVGADANGNTLSYLASGLPGGLSIAGSTGLISGTPTTAGTFSVTASVSDGSLSATRNFTWTIAPANVAPTLASVANQSGTVGVPASLQLVGADANGNTLSYSASGLPAGLSIASSTGVISGTPTTAGTFSVTASVSDGSLSVTRNFTWTIAPANVAPTLASVSNRTGTVGVPASLQLVGADANGNTLSYLASGLPGGLSIASSTGMISGTPTTAGTFAVTASVSDGSLSATRNFTWTIAPANVAPTLASVGNQSGTVGVAASLQLVGADANGNALSYSASGLPGGLSIAGATGLISGTPTTSGTFSVTATVSDGSLSASRNFTWTIAAAPQLIESVTTTSGKVARSRTKVASSEPTKDYTGSKAKKRETTTTTTSTSLTSVSIGRASTRSLIDGTTSASTTSSGSMQTSLLTAKESSAIAEVVETSEPAPVETQPAAAPVAPGTAPAIIIDTPVDQAKFASGALIIFSARAHDAEDGDLSSRLVWTSNVDGKIGTGGTVLKILRRGVHAITASVTDTDGRVTTTRITIRVGQ